MTDVCSNPRHRFLELKWYSAANLEQCSRCGICIPRVNALDKFGFESFNLVCLNNSGGENDDIIEEMLWAGAKYVKGSFNMTANVRVIKNFEKEQDEATQIYRPALVACAGQVLPPELAELCGDYCCMTTERRAIDERLNAYN